MEIFRGTPYTRVFYLSESDCVRYRDKIVSCGFFTRAIYSCGRIGLEFVTNDAPNILDFGICEPPKFCDAVRRLERRGYRVRNWFGLDQTGEFDVLVESGVYDKHRVLWVATKSADEKIQRSLAARGL